MIEPLPELGTSEFAELITKLIAPHEEAFAKTKTCHDTIIVDDLPSDPCIGPNHDGPWLRDNFGSLYCKACGMWRDT
jgi:hypothetical protein